MSSGRDSGDVGATSSSGGPADSTGIGVTSGGSTTNGAACTACVDANCSAEDPACAPDVCACWFDCVAGGIGSDRCAAACSGAPSAAAIQCAVASCSSDCFPDAATHYEECGPTIPCTPDLVCVNVPRHCSFDCQGDVSVCPPAPPGGSAPVVCDATLGACILDCSTEACPPGMTCLTFGDIDLCGF
jgi:hypothetical protein